MAKKTQEESIVSHRAWKNTKVLYDDKEFSAIWGKFAGKPNCLGIRWNKVPTSVGFPNQGGQKLWFVVPDWLVKAVLFALFDRVKKKPANDKLKVILAALKECQ